MIAVGEQITAGLLAMGTATNRRSRPPASPAIRPASRPTTRTVRRASSTFAPTRCAALWKPASPPVVPGFQGRAPDGSVTTLGRGGVGHDGGRPRRRPRRRRVPDLHRCRRHLHNRSAPLPESPSAQACHLQGNVGNVVARFKGAAASLGRIRRKIQGAVARLVLVVGVGRRNWGYNDKLRRRRHGSAIITGITYTQAEAKNHRRRRSRPPRHRPPNPRRCGRAEHQHRC